MKCKKKIHKVWKEMEIIRKKYPEEFRNHIISKWHYLYSSKKGEISLIELIDYFPDSKNIWEIYDQGVNLFDDVERFATKKEAEKRIKKLLE